MNQRDQTNEDLNDLSDKNIEAANNVFEIKTHDSRVTGKTQDRPHDNPRGKIKELSVFTIGLGVILATLTLWLSFAMQPAPGQPKSSLAFFVPLGIAALLIALGILTRVLRSPLAVKATIVAVVLGFALDLFVGFNPVRAVIDFLIIALIIKTGRQALTEAENQCKNGTEIGS